MYARKARYVHTQPTRDVPGREYYVHMYVDWCCTLQNPFGFRHRLGSLLVMYTVVE